jgi:hypothetical protein
MKGLGYCDMHYQRFKKYGDPLLVKDNQFSPIRTDREKNPIRTCRMTDCGRTVHAHGLCGMHAMRQRRSGVSS